jgi:phosphopentomutase
MYFGHRNNVEGYAQALLDFDNRMPELLEALDDRDMLIITADHGCDPTTEGTDHTREYVPLLVYGKQLRKGVNLHIRKTFADVAQTIAELLNTEGDFDAESFYKDVVL